MPSFTHLKINQDRLVETIHETSGAFGAKGRWGTESTETGVCRLALSDDDKLVRDWFIKQVTDLGCEVKIDEIGNIFAIYPGKDNSVPPTAIGSHLDTQPTGGRYDGILGVLGGLEVLRTIHDNKLIPNYPIAVINWTNEEGARFPLTIMSSGVWAGQTKLEDAYNCKSITDGDKVITVKDELERIGYLGSVPASHKLNPIAAHFEIHIEQGPILEERGKKVAVVHGVQAYSWWRIHVSGRAQHTGSTPFRNRSDALLTSCKMITRANEIATEFKGLCSVGILDLDPGVANVIPGDVCFFLDARHHVDETLDKMLKVMKSEFERIAEAGNGTENAKPLGIRYEHVQTCHTVKFNKDCIASTKEAAIAVLGEDMVIDYVSGVGHDSCNTSKVVPSSLFFVPCKDGISHNFCEYTAPDDVGIGIQVMLESVLRYDAYRAEQS